MLKVRKNILPALFAILTILFSFILATIITDIWLFDYFDYMFIFNINVENLSIINKFNLLFFVLILSIIGVIHLDMWLLGRRLKREINEGIRWVEMEEDVIKWLNENEEKDEWW